MHSHKRKMHSFAWRLRISRFFGWFVFLVSVILANESCNSATRFEWHWYLNLVIAKYINGNFDAATYLYMQLCMNLKQTNQLKINHVRSHEIWNSIGMDGRNNFRRFSWNYIEAMIDSSNSMNYYFWPISINQMISSR